MQCHSRTDTRQEVHLARIAELFFGRGCRRRLNELSEASARIGESPGGKFDAKCFQRGKNLLTRARVHANLSVREGRLHSIPRAVTVFFGEPRRFAMRNRCMPSAGVKTVHGVTHGVKLVPAWRKGW